MMVSTATVRQRPDSHKLFKCIRNILRSDGVSSTASIVIGGSEYLADARGAKQETPSLEIFILSFGNRRRGIRRCRAECLKR